MINRTLAENVKKLMPENLDSGQNDRPVSVWKELDRLNGNREKTAVAIFRTTGCSWYNFSSCSMCGYFNDVSRSVNASDLKKQIDFISDQIGEVKSIKIFTSGSFLDPREIPLDVRDYFFNVIGHRMDKVLIESRTEYLTDRNLAGLSDYADRIRIAIGVESTNDLIIRDSINKGTNYSKFLESAKTVRRMGFETRSYLLLKPPFISEVQAVRDTIRSVEMVSAYSNDVSINPMNIQRNTYVEYLWKKGLYRPPRLWSLADVLLNSSDFGTEVVSYPTGGNRERGIHNDKDDPKLLDLIVDASLDQDFSNLEKYVKESDKQDYEVKVNLEDTQSFQCDYDRLVNRVASASFYI
ncbi:MAG: archaeosine biosynthesis radical SAM protein RaSEA [Thermoplasmataceae archaeon]|jgi:radical SAM enzyme (TIGR01210 family)